MTRGGYIKNVGSGIFSLFPPAKRVMQKIEKIIREEMNAINGQEIMLPIVMPAGLWKESGRYDSVGNELVRFRDRTGSDMVLGMTHEEAVVHLVRDVAPSHGNYPFMVYQIQTKVRDEPRARGGLIRVREFTMKDAYSFHTSQECLEEYYQECYAAYERIFKRCGLTDVISVIADPGMMGGKIAHEFMSITDVGEDYLALCNVCDYRANMEIAPCIATPPALTDNTSLTLVKTPDCRTIDDVAAFVKVPTSQTCKAVMYRKQSNNQLVIVFLRGDLEINEIKLRNFLKDDIEPDTSNDKDISYGFCGPIGLSEKAEFYFDNSLKSLCNLVVGANREDHHYTGFTPSRDTPNAQYADLAKIYVGALCPKCDKPEIVLKRGAEVGHIFQLGKKYTQAAHMSYTDESGTERTPTMGCYGIGVGRLAALVCEAHNDDYGPIWPISIAPWQVHICALRSNESGETASAIYKALQKVGVEVIYDDRKVSPGVMFSDADLLGCPLRVIVSPKTLARDVVEFVSRDKAIKQDLPLGDIDNIIAEIKRHIQNA